MTKQYSIWHPLWLAYFSKALYRDVGQCWKGVGLLYLLILAAIYSVLGTYNIHNMVNGAIYQTRPIVSQLPDMTFTDGKLSIDKPSPFIVTDPANQRPLAIIDTSGKTTSLDGSPALVLLTQNQLIIKNSPMVTKQYSLSEVTNGTYTQETINGYLDQAVSYAPFAIFPFVLVITFVKLALIVFVFAALAVLFIHSQLSYTGICRITSVALTPVLLLIIILNVLNVRLPYELLIYFLVAWVYIFYGIDMNIVSPKTPEIPSPPDTTV